MLSDFCETDITKLRGRDPTVFEIFLMSDLETAHSKKVINLCNKYGIVKQAQQAILHSITLWWKDGFELMVRGHDVN